MNIVSQQREALINSINHWQIDIIDKFEVGHFVIISGYNDHWNDNSNIQDKTKYCSLCYVYYTCQYCPYTQYYGYNCNQLKSHWNTWRRHLNLETAIAMKDALIRILVCHE